MGAIDRIAKLSKLFEGYGPARYEYTGRALVTLDRMSLLDMDQPGLPDMLGQLDVQPGMYQVEIRLVRRTELPEPRRPLSDG